MKWNRLAAAASTCAVVMVISACGGSGDSSGSLEELTVAYPQEASNFDPVISTEVPTTEPMRNVFETLLTQDDKGEPTPMLAESFTQSKDNKQLTFVLRKGVKFHDGSTMDADDVVASMNRWLENSAAAKYSFDGATIEKTSDTEVTMKLKTPNSAAALVLAYGESSIPLITTAENAEAAGSNPMTENIGTGPFKFKAWNKGQNLQLSRFDDYTPVDSEPNGLAGNRTAHFENLTYEFTPDPSTEVSGLQSGKYDVAEVLPYDNYDQLAADSSLSLDLTDKVSMPNLYFNKKEGLFADVKAREALAVGLDRDAILKSAYSDSKFYEAANGCMMPSALSNQWPCADSERPGSADSAKAKQLLADAGYDGEKVRIITSRDAGRAYQASTILQQQLKGLGINAELENFDYATLNSKRTETDAWELIVINNIAKIEPLQQFYIPEDNPGWTEQNALKPIVDDYQSAETVEDQQKVYAEQMQEWFTSYIPVVNLGSAADLYAVKEGIEGVRAVGGSLVLWSATAR